MVAGNKPMRAIVADAMDVRTMSHPHSKYRCGSGPQQMPPSGEVELGVSPMAAIVARA